jgi:hypothetical protein
VAAVVGWRISSYWLDETGVSCMLAGYIGLVLICNQQGNGLFCVRRRGKRRERLWEIVKLYVLLTELSWCRNSTGRVAVFPLGRERRFFVARHVFRPLHAELQKTNLELCKILLFIHEKFVDYKVIT